MRTVLSTLITAFCCVFVLVSCSGSATTMQADPGGTAGDTQVRAGDDHLPAIAELPKTSSALTEELDLRDPVSTSAHYNDGILTLTESEEMAWAVFEATRYTQDDQPDLLRLYGLEASCDTFWVGFADYEMGAWRWVQATKDETAEDPYDGQNLVYAPDDGEFYREADNAAFVAIVMYGMDGGDTEETVSFSAARLAARSGMFYEENFTVDSEADLAQLDGYSAIEGNLTIDCSTVANLDALDGLLLVGGDLELKGLTERHQEGLAYLTTVNGTLDIVSSQGDFNFELPLLIRSGKLVIRANNSISKVYMDSLQILDDLEVVCSSKLMKINFPELTTVNNRLQILGIDAPEYPGSTELHLPSLQSVGSSLTIQMMPELLNLSLPDLTSTGDIFINTNPKMQTIYMPSLRSFVKCELEALDSLNTVTFSDLFSIIPETGWMSSVEINGCAELTSIDFLKGYNDIDLLELEIKACPELTNLDGLEGVRSTTILTLENLPSLIDTTAIDGLGINSSIEHYPSMRAEIGIMNTALSSLPELEFPVGIPIGELSVYKNPNLTDLTQLSGLTTIENYIFIIDNDSLSNLTGLNNLVQIASYTYIAGNDNLLNLDALSNVTTLTPDNTFVFSSLLNIEANPSLASISGLSGLQPNSTGYVIDGFCNITNNALTGGDADAWDLINAWGGEATVYGDVTISGN